jgi:beta-glucosidase
MVDFLPDRSWHPLDVLSTRAFSWFYNQKWLNAVMGKRENFGVPGLLPKQPLVKEAIGRRTCDYIGLNYYMKAHVKWSPGAPDMPFAVEYARDDDTVSDLGWAVHPSGFGKMIRKVARYGLPIYITENGIADADDNHRTNYIKTHLEEVAKAIQDGADVRGFYYWSLLDNFEWIKGYGPRFGLFHVDYETFTRTERASASYYRRVIQAHGGCRAPSLAEIQSERTVVPGLKSQFRLEAHPRAQEP